MRTCYHAKPCAIMSTLPRVIPEHICIIRFVTQRLPVNDCYKIAFQGQSFRLSFPSPLYFYPVIHNSVYLGNMVLFSANHYRSLLHHWYPLPLLLPLASVSKQQRSHWPVAREKLMMLTDLSKNPLCMFTSPQDYSAVSIIILNEWNVAVLR